MKILVACEESQRVCSAFRERGHEAYSCDLIGCSGGHPEWHIQDDVLPLLNGNCTFITCDKIEHILNQKWDMIIAFPPCTHLATSGARHFEKKREDGRQREGIEFFCQFLEANCDKIIIENPVGIISGKYINQYFPDLCKKYKLPRKPTQIIEPWQFGDNFTKKTCLWEFGVAPLVPKIKEKPLNCPSYANITLLNEKGETISWNSDASKKLRSKTFYGIAQAMAEQWG